jgi:hypothetical protein
MQIEAKTPEELKQLMIYYFNITEGKKIMTIDDKKLFVEYLFKPQLFKFLEYK